MSELKQVMRTRTVSVSPVRALINSVKTVRLFNALIRDERVSNLRVAMFLILGIGLMVVGVDAIFDFIYATIPFLDLTTPIFAPVEAIIEACGVVPLLLMFFPADVRSEHIARIFGTRK